MDNRTSNVRNGGSTSKIRLKSNLCLKLILLTNATAYHMRDMEIGVK